MLRWHLDDKTSTLPGLSVADIDTRTGGAGQGLEYRTHQRMRRRQGRTEDRSLLPFTMDALDNGARVQ
jgi:hypothetical protein